MIETNAIADIRATITANRRESRDISVITLECPEIARAAKPGNFVNIKVNESTQPLLRRPFSIHNVKGSSIEIMVKSIGHGTSILNNSDAGKTVMVLGPLGNNFNTSGQNFDTAILLSGGIGTAPMLFLEKTVTCNKRKVINLVGGRSKEELIASGLSNIMFATDDGSAGFHGNVVELLESVLPDIEKTGGLKVFACGPNPMLKAVAACCRKHHLPGELSLESVMGCGIGICYGCSVETQAQDGSTRTILLCREGPVIDSELFVL